MYKNRFSYVCLFLRYSCPIHGDRVFVKKPALFESTRWWSFCLFRFGICAIRVSSFCRPNGQLSSFRLKGKLWLFLLFRSRFLVLIAIAFFLLVICVLSVACLSLCKLSLCSSERVALSEFIVVV